MVPRQDFATMVQLTEKAEEYETFLRASQSFRQPPPPSLALIPETAYHRSKNSEKAVVTAAVESVTKPRQNSCNEVKRPCSPQNSRPGKPGLQ